MTAFFITASCLCATPVARYDRYIISQPRPRFSRPFTELPWKPGCGNTKILGDLAELVLHRLEERLRLSSLLSEPLRSRIPELTEGQLVAIRFASDAEVPGVVERTLAGNLPRAEIKKSIQNWRPDCFRV
jgi:hypothetical protein